MYIFTSYDTTIPLHRYFRIISKKLLEFMKIKSFFHSIVYIRYIDRNLYSLRKIIDIQYNFMLLFWCCCCCSAVVVSKSINSTFQLVGSFERERVLWRWRKIMNFKKLFNLPTWRTFSTQFDSSNLRPLQKLRFCASPLFVDDTLLIWIKQKRKEQLLAYIYNMKRIFIFSF